MIGAVAARGDGDRLRPAHLADIVDQPDMTIVHLDDIIGLARGEPADIRIPLRQAADIAVRGLIDILQRDHMDSHRTRIGEVHECAGVDVVEFERIGVDDDELVLAGGRGAVACIGQAADRGRAVKR